MAEAVEGAAVVVRRERGPVKNRLDHIPLYIPGYGGGRGGHRARNLFSLYPLSLSLASTENGGGGGGGGGGSS